MDHPTFRLEHRAKSYSRIHGILIERRGYASGYLCPCGKQADQWAYRHGSEHELRRADGVPYSTDLRDYVAMCYRCHWEYDLPYKERTAGSAVRQKWREDPEFRERRLTQVRAAQKKAVQAPKSRYRCEMCGLETNAGMMGRHFKSSGHEGRVKL